MATDHARPREVSNERLEDFLGAMRRGGLRITTPRRIIARNLLAIEGHVTGQRLATRVRGEAPEIDQSTVYRFLESVSSLGLTEHHHVDTGPPVHHLIDESHVHLVCTECGDVSELSEAELRQHTTQFTDRYGFTIRPRRFALEGVCARCTERGGAGDTITQ